MSYPDTTQVTADVPGLTVPDSWMFAHPTRVADFFVAYSEKILHPGRTLKPIKLNITVERGETGRHLHGLRDVVKLAKNDPGAFVDSVDAPSDAVLFDVRSDTDRNPAHVMAMAAGILLAKRELSQNAGKDVVITAVVGAHPSNVIQSVLSLLGVPFIATDRNVRGRLIREAHEIRYANLVPLIPRDFNFSFQGYRADTPKRVYFPRRGAREVINDAEVSSFFEKRGFKTISPEKLSVAEQWSLARNAEVAAVVHGASWWSFHLSRAGLDANPSDPTPLKMLDLFSPAFTLNSINTLATVLNGRYCSVRGQITPEILQALEFDAPEKEPSPLKPPAPWPFKVSIASLERALDCLEVD